MFAYKTNSPQYLDYIASVKSRKQIQADPDLCLLLENPYIKDNMEMAIRWNEAKYGDYQAKYDFLEYFMCNGPELDADTILHYRAKSFNDPVIMEIAYSYFSSPSAQREIRDKRKNKYNKNLDDCFQNPCFYLGRFTPMMGALGDEKKTYGIFTWMANKLKSDGSVQQVQATQKQQVSTGQTTPADANKRIEAAKQTAKDNEEKQGDTQVRPPADSRETVNDAPAVGGGSKQAETTFLNSVQKGWDMWWKDVVDGTSDFTDELINSTNAITNANNIGDWMSNAIQKKLNIITKANVKRNLGDCSRLWSQLRNMKLFSPDKNKFGPISPQQLTGSTTPQGTNTKPIKNPSPCVNEASSTINEYGKLTEAWPGYNTSEEPIADDTLPAWLEFD